MLTARRKVSISCAVRRHRSTTSGPAPARAVKYRPALQEYDVGLHATDVPDVKQRIEILESIQLVKERRVAEKIKENQNNELADATLSPVESYLPLIGGMYTSASKTKAPFDHKAAARKEKDQDLLRARLLLGSEEDAQLHLADREARERLQIDITRKAHRDEAMEQDKRPPLKANDPDPSKLTIDEMILPDDSGIFKDELYPALRKKPPIVYVPDVSDLPSPFYQAKVIENPRNPGEMLEIEVRGANLHLPAKLNKEPKVRGHRSSKSFIDRLAYEDMTEMEDQAQVILANPDAHQAWQIPDEFARNQELSYASYPRHPDYADPFRVYPPLKLGCGFCKGRYQDKRLEPMNTPFLIRFLYPDGSIMRRAHTGLCMRHQKRVARTIKRARCMKIFSFKNGVFGVQTPYPLPKIWRLHLASFKVPNPHKMDTKLEDEQAELLHDEVFGTPKEKEDDNDLPSIADTLAYDDYEEADFPISDTAQEREMEAERSFYEKQRAADHAAAVPVAVELEYAKTNLMHGVLAEQDAEGFDSLEAESLFQQLKELNPEAAKKIAIDKQLIAEIRETADREAENEVEDRKLLKQQAKIEEKLRQGEATEETINHVARDAREEFLKKSSDQHDAHKSATRKWTGEEDVMQALLNAVRDNEVRAARLQADHEKVRATHEDVARLSTVSAQQDAMFAGLRPLNFNGVTTKGAEQEEAQLINTAKRVSTDSRWWREGVSNVDNALKDATLASRIEALVESACAAAMAQKVAFVRPTIRAAALLLYMQIENAPPVARSISNATHVHKLSAEGMQLSRDLFRLLGEERGVESIEEVQAVVLDRLDAVKDRLKTPKLKAAHEALKERVSSIATLFRAPTLGDILTGTERDIAAASKPKQEALMLFRTLRSTVVA